MLQFGNAFRRRVATLSLELPRRWYAVKVLPWCAKGGPTKAFHTEEPLNDHNAVQSWKPIPRFSIVAAMSLNRIIGVDGSLPWEHLEQDRKIFTDLTANQVIILGRATFHEKADLSHIRHAACCIVVSTTMGKDKLAHQWGGDVPPIKFAASFPQALDMARTLCDERAIPATDAGEGERSSMTCWVVGGERLYNEAVMHASLDTIHLSIVNRTIDEHPDQLIRRFPPKYRWDHKFILVSEETFDGFEYQKYSRNRGLV
jgi:dihydrofolate reductase